MKNKNLYAVKTPSIVQRLFPTFLWRFPTKEKVLYLTFDDGPIPEVTPWVLATLKQFDAKATFFCVGDNVQKHPKIFAQLKAEGHRVGNHTFHHLDGWKSKKSVYLEDVKTCANVLNSNLFRPPYGHLKPNQVKELQKDYQIVLWDILSGDFDPQLSKEECLQNVLGYAKEGSIIVFHDSLKAEEKLRYVLPRVLEHYRNLGFRFERIEKK